MAHGFLQEDRAKGVADVTSQIQLQLPTIYRNFLPLPVQETMLQDLANDEQNPLRNPGEVNNSLGI